MVSNRWSAPIRTAERRNRRLQAALPLLWLLGLTILAHSSRADDVAQPSDHSSAQTQESRSASETPDAERRRHTATVGILLLLGVVAVGVLAVAGALIAGARLRRLARQTERAPSRQDELWYLKNKEDRQEGIPTATTDAPEDEDPKSNTEDRQS